MQGSLSRGAKCKTPEAKRLKFFDQAEVVHGSASRANNSSKGAGKRENPKRPCTSRSSGPWGMLKTLGTAGKPNLKKDEGIGQRNKEKQGENVHSWLADWEQVELIKQVMAGLKKWRENCQRNTTRNNTRILRNQRLQNKIGLIYNDWISCEPAAGDGWEEIFSRTRVG